jgi:hypothetical protein
MDVHMPRFDGPAGSLSTAVVIGALLLGACRDPQLVAASEPTGEVANVDGLPKPGPAANIPDPRDAVLVMAGRTLLASLEAARDDFKRLETADSAIGARATSLRLRAVMAADPRWTDLDGDGEPDDLGVRSLLPGPDSDSRVEPIDYGDALTYVLAVARDAGADGSAFADVMRDPMVADLGSWQRDAGGLLQSIESAVTGVRTLEDAERVVGDLVGEAPKALAWALLAVATDDLSMLQAYGARGVVHIELIIGAVVPLLEG